MTTRPFSACINNIFNGCRFRVGAYLPRVLRSRFLTTAGGSNSITASPGDVSQFDSWKEGLFDGGEACVYRITNGAMTLVRQSTITAHRASGWNNIVGYNTITPTGTTTFTYNFQNWNRNGVTQWFTVRAVNSAGDKSPAATAVTHTTPSSWPSNVTPSNTTASKTLTDTINGAIATPTNLQIASGNSGMHAILTWDAVPGVDGYVVEMTDYDPAEHVGYGFDLESHAEPILAGDMVFIYKTFREIDRQGQLTNRVHNVYQEYYKFSHGGMPLNDAGAAARYVLVDHDLGAAIPGKGQTFARLTVSSGAVNVGAYMHGYKRQTDDYYEVLDPTKTYRVDVWMKADDNRTVTFEPDMRNVDGTTQSGNSVTWNVTTSWQKFTHEFSPSVTWEDFAGIGLVRMVLGAGVWDIDSIDIYETSAPSMMLTPSQKAEIDGFECLRFHHHCKTAHGTYDLDQLTNAANYISCPSALGATLHSSLAACLDAGVLPWLQVEMHFKPEEWDGLVEYLAGTTGQWAAKRIAQGQTTPWIDAFERIYFELSNETWNSLFTPWVFDGMTDSATAQAYGYGQVYGKFQEYVIARMKAAPAWNAAMESKFKFMLGGFALNSYSADAANASPNSHFVTIAPYNGGWELGAAVPIVGEGQSYRNTLFFTEQNGEGYLETLNAGIAGTDIGTGSYEAGPGYGLNGLNGQSITAFEDQSQERVGKSKASGAATIDTFLTCALYGMEVQAFYTFGYGQKWTSHAMDYRGGGACPPWMYLQLFNQHCVGLEILPTTVTYGPRFDIPARTGYPAKNDADEVAIYLLGNETKLCLWCVSRKLPYSDLDPGDDLYNASDDGVTTAHVKLPISAATTVKRYRMDGEWNQHNCSTDAVIIYRQLAYDGGTVAFSAGTAVSGTVLGAVTGQTVTGLTSGATGIVWRITGTTASGTLDLYNVQGTFQDNEELQVGGSTYAIANGTAGSQRAYMALGVADGLYHDFAITEETLVVDDVENFTVPGGIPPANADLYVFEGIAPKAVSTSPRVTRCLVSPTSGTAPLEFKFACDASAHPLTSLTFEVRKDNVPVATQSGSTFLADEAGVYTVRPILVSGSTTATLAESQMLNAYNGNRPLERIVVA